MILVAPEAVPGPVGLALPVPAELAGELAASLPGAGKVGLVVKRVKLNPISTAMISKVMPPIIPKRIFRFKEGLTSFEFGSISILSYFGVTTIQPLL
jgi:hypothetical protein